MKLNDGKLWSAHKTYKTNYLPVIRRQSINSILASQKAVDLFVDFIEESYEISFSQIDASFFTAENIVSFEEWLKNRRHNLPSTINNRITCIKQFCKYLFKEKVIDVVDYTNIQEIKKIPDLRPHTLEWLSVEELEVVFDNFDKSDSIGFRNWMIMKFLYETGCRIQELLNVKLKDITVHKDGTGTVRLFGKGKKERFTPLQSNFIIQLKKYFGLFHKAMNLDEYLFYTVKHDPDTYREIHTKMSSDTPAQMLKTYEKSLRQRIPEQKHLHCHLFRHTRAMHLYAVAGIDLNIVSDLLGHSSIETTQLYYARATLDMKRAAADKLEKHLNFILGDLKIDYEDDEQTLKKLYGLK